MFARAEMRMETMQHEVTPVRILLVDDEPGRHLGLKAALRDKATVVVRDPSEVLESDLSGVDLVSVDEYLGSDWEARVREGGGYETIALRNEDGLSVAAAFRSQARSQNRNFAVSLHTGDLDKLASGLPDNTKEALTAAQHDLDWVFRFGGEDFGPRLLELAYAVRSATESATSMQQDFGAAWLRLPTEVSWAETARDQIEDCRPPAHGLADNTKGRSYLRWLAQRILPYPTFLIDDYHAANLLGITSASFTILVEHISNPELYASYSGPLEGFSGRRWWRAAWQQYIMDCGANPWDSSADRTDALRERTGLSLEPLLNDQAVVLYDGSGKLVSIDGDPNRAVRLQADGWPTYADDPWGNVESVRSDSGLLRLVSNFDRSRMPELAQ